MDLLFQRAPSRQIGAYAVNLDTGNEILARGIHVPLEPASVLKLLISYAALLDLKPEYVFHTDFFLSGRGKAPNLTVRGGGDPSLTSESLFLIARELVRRGVSSIHDLVLDDSKFEPLDRKGARAYEASAHALSLNYNSLRVWACLGNDGEVRTGVDPEVYHPAIKTKITRGKETLLAVEQFDTPEKPFALSGTLSPNDPCGAAYRSVEDVPDYFGRSFRQLLLQAGVHITGEIRSGRVSDNDEMIYSYASKPLAEIIFGLNHFSTNMIAETLLNSIACGAPSCSRADGLARLEAILKQEGVSPADFHLEDASGLSHANKVSPFALLRILKAAVLTPAIEPEFLASLSVLGRAGTLKHREVPDNGVLFRGKTGSLDGVSSLAGLLETRRGSRVLVVLIENAVPDKAHAAKWEESILQALYENE